MCTVILDRREDRILAVLSATSGSWADGGVGGEITEQGSLVMKEAKDRTGEDGWMDVVPGRIRGAGGMCQGDTQLQVWVSDGMGWGGTQSVTSSLQEPVYAQLTMHKTW